MNNRALYIILLTLSCAPSVPEFDEGAAWRHLLDQCAFGPRNPGSDGHARCRDYIVSALSLTADTVFVQTFDHVAHDGNAFVGENIVARFRASKQPRILLCAHWDTRPWADQDPDTARRDEPIIGASDGASGVAVILALAQAIAREEPLYGVDVAFFDLEDYGEARDTSGFCAGSRYFAAHPPFPLAREAILLDLVGDRDLQLPQESYSRAAAPKLCDDLWRAAQEAGSVAFHPWVGSRVYDDHVALIDAGVEAVDVVDVQYSAWHTHYDAPDACSPQSLGQVGRALVRLLYRREP